MSEQKTRFISSWDSTDCSSCPQNNIECAYQLMTWVDICKSFCRQAFTVSRIIVGFLLIVESFFLPFLIFLKSKLDIRSDFKRSLCVCFSWRTCPQILDHVLGLERCGRHRSNRFGGIKSFKIINCPEWIHVYLKVRSQISQM